MFQVGTMDLFEKKPKCIMPFDSKDSTLSSYLNVSPRLHENILPLWSMNNFPLQNEDRYYEFEVIESENTTNCDKFSSCSASSYTESDARETVLGRVMCHICNTEVPTVCISEHLSSSKHRTFSKIAEISLERVKKQMYVSHAPTIETPPAGYVFCDCCVDLIPQGDLSQHLTSKSHRNAQLLDQLLLDLLRIYSDGSDGSDVANNRGESTTAPSKASGSSRGSSRNRSGKSVNTSTTLTSQAVNVDSGKTSNGKPNGAIGKIDAGKIIVDRREGNAETVTVDSEKDASDTAAVVGKKNAKPVKKDLNKKIVNCLGGDLEEYIRSVNTEGRFDLDVVDCGLLVQVNGVQARVELADFHALSALGKRHYMCGLCKTICLQLDKHIHSQPHLDKLALPIDRNFVREIDDDKGHCILCNDIVENSDVHALCSKEHEAKLNLSLVPHEEDAFRKPVKSNESTKASEREEPIGKDPANDVRKMSSGKGSVANKEEQETTVENASTNVPGGNVDEVLCRICFIRVDPEKIESHERTPEHMSNESLAAHHLLEYSSTYMTLKCKVCLTGFPIHMKEEHITSPFHQYNYKKLLAANTMTRSAHSVFCNTCVAYMRIGDELIHITSKTHITLTVNVLACSESEIAEAQKKANEQHYCAVCSKYVPGDAKNLKTHKSGAKHKRNLAALEAAKDNKGNNEKTQAQKAVVTTPEVVVPVPKAVVPQKAAVTNPEAVVPVPKAVVPQKSIVPAPKTVESTVEYSNASQGTITRDFIRATAKATVVECKVCSTTLPNTPAAIYDHLEAYAHTKNVIEFGKADLSLHDDIYWCAQCDICVHLGGQFQHLSDAQHRENAMKSLVDKMEGKKRPIDQLDPLDLNTLRSTENKGTTRCQVCDVLVPGCGSTLRMHFTGRKHRSQLVAFLAENSIIEKDEQLSCAICRCSIQRSSLFQHVANSSHTSKKTALTAAADREESTRKAHQEQQKKSAVGGGGEIRVESSVKQCVGGGKSNSNGKDQNIDVKDGKVIGKEEEVETKTNGQVYFCGVCDVQLTTGEVNVSFHNDGARHKNNLVLMVKNRVRVVDGGCYCEACDITFSRNSLQQHTVSLQHLMLL